MFAFKKNGFIGRVGKNKGKLKSEGRNIYFQHIWNPRKGKVGNLSHGSDCEQADIWVFASQASWRNCLNVISHISYTLFFFSCPLFGCPISVFDMHCVSWNVTWIMSQVTPPISLFWKVHASETTSQVPAHWQEAQKECYHCRDKVIKRKITWEKLFLEISFSVVPQS